MKVLQISLNESEKLSSARYLQFLNSDPEFQILNRFYPFFVLFPAGDFVKFGFPMASSVTMLAWGGISYQQGYSEAGKFSEF